MSPMLLVSLPPSAFGRAEGFDQSPSPHGERDERAVMQWVAIAFVAALSAVLPFFV